MEVCHLGRKAFGLGKYDTPCPAMMFADDKVRCGLVVAEKEAGLSPMLHNALGIGMGCDADDDDDFAPTLEGILTYNGK